MEPPIPSWISLRFFSSGPIMPDLRKWKDYRYKYRNGIVQIRGQLNRINGMSDHDHILISRVPKHVHPDLMFHLKRSSSLWVIRNKLPAGFHGSKASGLFHLVKQN